MINFKRFANFEFDFNGFWSCEMDGIYFEGNYEHDEDEILVYITNLDEDEYDLESIHDYVSKQIKSNY